MGSASSKFRRHLQNGDEYAALQIFQNSVELQHNLDPNSSYGDSLDHNTPLHLVSKHAIKPLLRIFLTELKGNPTKPNSLGATPLHYVCQGDLTRNASVIERRISCLNLILQWKGPSEEKVDLACVDNVGNTALHYAASTGLKKCVEILVSCGAPLFVANELSETPIDLAMRNQLDDIARYLETKMVFFTDEIESSMSSNDEEISEEENKTGLRAQDLQEAKDQLLVETSDMLHVPLFTAEVLLRNHEWSRQSLLDAWMNDPVSCCKEAGVQAPPSATNFSATADSLKMCCEQIQNEYQNKSLNSPARVIAAKEEIMCEICVTSLHSEDLIQIPCLHQFCKECWTSYLTAKIVEGEVHNILCPAFQCPHLVPVDVIERLVSADMVKRYLQFDIKAFVESNPSMKWCPHPGCGRAVKVPKFEKVNEELLAISFISPPPLSHAVDCGNGHYFCWECLKEAHAPCGCEKWKEWFTKIAEVKPQELKNTYAESEAAENSLWMVTNSKPCPNCKCPIQKNEGCNHMKCSKCRYEFCWVCLDPWKKHGPGTGGYFRCNRQDAVKRAEAKEKSLISEAEEHNKQLQELKRFLHYYTKFKNHENNYEFEEPLLKSIQEKANVLLASVELDHLKSTDMSFLEDAVYELLRSRKILCGSYVYGYYLEDNGYTKTIFDYLLNDLEKATEKLSEAVACKYLQTPLTKIIQMISHMKRKRQDLMSAVNKGLIPPETPPGLRKSKKRRLPGLMGMDPEDDPQVSQAILDSLENFDPNNPWIIDEQGRHTNVAAVCDWPDFDSDDEASNSIVSSFFGVCSREGCNRPRAKNLRTGEIHDFCSLSCKHWDVIKSPGPKIITPRIDPNVDKLIALEMSKLQIDCVQNDNDESIEQNINHDPNINPIQEVESTDTSLENDLEISESPCPELTSVEEQSILNCELLKTLDNSAMCVSQSVNNPNINFYLKDSCGALSNNLNVSGERNSSKTEKELFKVFRKPSDVDDDSENIQNVEENIS